MQDECWSWSSGSRTFRLATHFVEIISRQPDENWEWMGMKIIVIRMAVFAFACVCNRTPVNYQLYISIGTQSRHLCGRWWICMGRREIAMVRKAMYTDSNYKLKQINSYETLCAECSLSDSAIPFTQLMNRITYSAESTENMWVRVYDTMIDDVQRTSILFILSVSAFFFSPSIKPCNFSVSNLVHYILEPIRTHIHFNLGLPRVAGSIGRRATQ